jgi:hypothetical protein
VPRSLVSIVTSLVSSPLMRSILQTRLEFLTSLISHPFSSSAVVVVLPGQPTSTLPDILLLTSPPVPRCSSPQCLLQAALLSMLLLPPGFLIPLGIPLWLTPPVSGTLWTLLTLSLSFPRPPVDQTVPKLPSPSKCPRLHVLK